MNYRAKDRDEHLSRDGKPKRILAMDGGGLRGILTLGILSHVEDVLRQRHGGDKRFRLCHYFDLIAGTSTGSIIAAALAMGMSVKEVSEMYLALGERVFEKSLFRQGLFRAKYDEKALTKKLKEVYGATTTLGGSEIRTGLLVVAKRLDTGSLWPLSNNPNGKYYEADASSNSIPNKDYPLWKVVRASTAAPSFFEPESIEIAKAPGMKTVTGNFVDGGVSPFNNPALQAFMLATLEGYGLKWPSGPDRILLVSLGTGARDPQVTASHVAAKHAVASLVSLMDDCAGLVETMLQWMSESPTAREIDGELGSLANDALGGAPLMSYLRYNAVLEKKALDKLGLELAVEDIAPLNEMDDPEQMTTLKKIGERVGTLRVDPRDFPSVFDLTA